MEKSPNKWIIERLLKGTLTQVLAKCYMISAGIAKDRIETILKYSYVQDSLGLKCHANKRDAIQFAWMHRKAARFAFGAKHKKVVYCICPYI